MKFYNVVESNNIGANVYGVRASSEADALEKVLIKVGVKCLFAFVSGYYGAGMTNRIDLL